MLSVIVAAGGGNTFFNFTVIEAVGKSVEAGADSFFHE